MAATLQSGSVQKWMGHKGYGFIDYGENQSVFVHMNDLNENRQSLNIGENVTFEIIMDQNSGKTRGVNVTGDGTGTPAPQQRDFGGNRGGYGGNRGGGFGGNRGGGYGGNRGGGYGGNSGGYGGNSGGYGGNSGGYGGNSGGYGGNSGGYGGNRGGSSGGGRWQNSNSESSGICRNFQRDGTCRFGDRCRFSHTQ